MARDGSLQKLSRFPRASKYDLQWIMDNQMGPNALWLAEWLLETIRLRPEMKVLDLACGTAMTSIFLAKEFGIRVWAVDRDVPAAENHQRITKAGFDSLITPMQADATRLPFDPRFFDVILCIDAFEYFGTTADYLPYLAAFAKPGGAIGIVNAGLQKELQGKVPDYLQSLWLDEFNNFHSAQWWRELWQASGAVDIIACNDMPDGGQLWLEWERTIAAANPHSSDPNASLGLKLLEADAGRNLTFNRIAGKVK